MEIIQIIFFSIGSFFSIENSRIASWEVIVTIDPVAQSVEIQQNDIFTVALNEGDSARLNEQWELLIDEEQRELASALAGVRDFEMDFSKGKMPKSKEKILNATIEFKYTKAKQLEAFAIDYVDNEFSFINMPDWHLETEDGKLDGNYWHFPNDKSFTFSLHPFLEIPEKYKEQKMSLYTKYKK